jgi:DNA-binding transcriptional LysR family regulator
MLDTLACARADLDAISAGDSGTIHVGAFQSIAAALLPELIDRLAADEASFDVQLTESERELELLALLDSGALDFAFTLVPTDEARYISVELLRDQFFLVGAGQQADRLNIRELGELKEAPIIAPRTCRSWERIASQLEASGVTPAYAFRTDDNFTTKSLVQRGLGIAFVSGLTLDAMDAGLPATPVDHLVPARVIGLTWSRRRALTPPQLQFLDLAREVAASLTSG